MTKQDAIKISDALRDAQMFIEASYIDWDKMRDGPDHDPNYKPIFPEVVEKCREALRVLDFVWNRDGSKSAAAVFREVSEQLTRYKEKYFPLGVIVQVDCDRFKGVGVSVGKCSECPPDRLAVRVDSGHVWYYPLERCDIMTGSPVPSWISEMVKEPWWIDALSNKLHGFTTTIPRNEKEAIRTTKANHEKRTTTDRYSQGVRVENQSAEE